MNKKLSKLMTLLLTMVMVIGTFSSVALAEDLPPATGDLVIHKYLMADTADAGDPGDGTVVTPPSSATPLDGIIFKLYQVTIGADGIYPANGTITLNNYTNPGSFTDSNSKSFAVTEASTASVTTANGGAATASNLPQGIYLVVEQADSRVASPAAPFVVAVPMTNPTGDGWISSVHVYPKNESMSIEKTVNTSSVTIGDEVTYSITPSIPSDIGEAIKYDIVDQLDPALTYKIGSVKVKYAGTKADLAASDNYLTESTHYTVTYASGKLTVSLNAAGRAYLETNGFKFLQIDFVTTVNQNILQKPGYTVVNTADLEFTNQFGEDKNVSTDEGATLHVGAITVTKINASTSAVLQDAKFKIATSAVNAKNGVYLRKDASGNILDFGEVGYDTATDWLITTDASGKDSFAGIKDYTGSAAAPVYQKYWLVETQAPLGYNKLDRAVEVTFDATATEGNNYTMDVIVKNNQGFTLPKTGGTGTLLFTVGGIILVGVAVILIVATRKKKQVAE